MGFIFHRRIRLFGGLGLNVSKSGVSPSLRTAFGTIGLRGLTFRTGIPGLHWRKRWNSKSAGDFFLIVFTLWLMFIAVAASLVIAFYLLVLLYEVLRWLVLTLYDLYRWIFYRENPQQDLLMEYQPRLDPELVAAARIMVERQSATVPDIQRALGTGYNRSYQLLKAAEAAAIVGPPDEQRQRAVYFQTREELEAHLVALGKGGG
jgi:DNA segregation ATPase FtsK/SpoIIIE-like protein